MIGVVVGGNTPVLLGFIGSPTTPTIGTSADVWAQDLLAITFPTPLKNEANMQSPDSYAIVPRQSGQAVTVKAVQTGSEPFATTIYLVVTQPSIGETYKVFFKPLVDTTGVVTQPLGCEFIGRMTKQDSMIESRPQMYWMSPDGLMRKFLQAIGRQDDLIGGSRKDRFQVPQRLVRTPIVVDMSPQQTGAGATVLIEGTNFTGTTAVDFNGAAASSFQVLDDETITAVVPAHTGTGPIHVTTPFGSAASTENFIGPP